MTRRLPSSSTAGLASGAVAAPAHVRLDRRSILVRPPQPPISLVPLHHLLRRCTYGATPALMAEVGARGVQAWFEDQLAPERIDDSDADRACARFPLAHAAPNVIETQEGLGSWAGMEDLIGLSIARATLSRRQLFEVMVDFWSNHINVTCPSSEVWSGRGSYDADVIRKHALGRYSDMLVASGRHPAMLQFLNGVDSDGGRGKVPNENYGRELLELHTVGRDGGYGQSGVLSAARAFSGFTVWRTWEDTPYKGLMRYVPERHYVGPLQVLGWSHPNSDRTQGRAVTESLLRYLAAHPMTAARIARKLVVRFVSDDPPQALVDRLAQVYLAGGTAIVPVLRALFTSPEFAASEGRKFRRPHEDIVATMRVLGVRASDDAEKQGWLDVGWQLGQCGQSPYGWHTPDGYPDVAPAWTGTGSIIGRWNLHFGLTQGIWWPRGFAPAPPNGLYARMFGAWRPADRTQLVVAAADRLMPGLPLPPAHVTALVAFLGGPGPLRAEDVTWQFPLVVALLLDSPTWSIR